MLGLRFCARAFSSCGERGPLFIAVQGAALHRGARAFTIMAPPVAEHRLQTRRLSSCGSRAYLLRGMWDLPRPGLEPVSPALAGRFSTTAPPGKPLQLILAVSWERRQKAGRRVSTPSSSFPPDQRSSSAFLVAGAAALAVSLPSFVES